MSRPRIALSAIAEGDPITLQGALAVPGRTLRVDHTTGIVYGVSVMAAGGAAGWNFDVDRVTLDQAMHHINAMPDGLKVHLTHDGTDPALRREKHIDPITVLVGRLRNARVEGEQTLADLHIGPYAAFSPQGDMRAFLLHLAETDPTAAGLSLVYDPAETMNRIRTLVSCDIVGDPAANPRGLLSRGPQEGKPAMSAKLRQYLVTLGMPATFTDGEARVFMSKKLTVEQAAQAVTLAEGDAPAEGEEAPPAGGDADLTPEESEAEDVFVARFVGSPEMQAKYPDGAERTRKAKEIFGATQQPAEEANAAVQEAEAMEAMAPVLSTKITPADRVKLERQTLAADKTRRDGIVALCAPQNLPSEYVQGLCDRGISVAQAHELVELAKTMKPIAMGRARIQVGEDTGRVTLAAGMRDAILLRSGAAPKTPHDRAREFRGMTVLEMGRRWMEANGMNVVGLSRMKLAALLLNRRRRFDKFGAVALAMGTSDFDAILRDAQGKKLLDSYRLAETTWQEWASRDTATDFKTQRRVRLSSAPGLLEKKEGAEYKFGAFSEGEETFVLATYGRRVSFTREMMINDDLSAFNRVTQQMGAKAKYMEDVLAYAILTANAALSDGVALFNASHSNVGTGVLSVASLTAMDAAMGIQKDLDDSTLIQIEPRKLIVPWALRIPAIELISSKVDPAKSNDTPNPFNNTLQIVASRHLDATSTLQWYGAADPSMVDTVLVSFLEDEQEPVTEDDVDFKTDDLHMKVRHQCVAKAIDHRGLYRSTGAA